ncbi:hypothetical protein BU24DRAFT_417506 [Aaosphaeria arxii CBS 175.79]|uniref:Aminoglycoside phosphotransferase domain-containing protein n=1 Tax=Aaosphaeria arxii CBS 175.79 TaxID=1450172 RepID=A0A6A5Y9H7_9PLEO|nr:uncharacterized protein BU24DRAFT_417506 [Aaosphaeria arxii CBS 175.79]KAF2021873.1 hypothetical protein BU24DRAFT_417506 [Aaosphaeria arxii CBS 175.79]
MATLELLSGPITFSEAIQRRTNVVHQLEYPRLQRAFFQRLQNDRHLIQNIVAHHLGADPKNCDVLSPEHWRHGSFNVCVPVRVDSPDPGLPISVMVRFPLPYRVGEGTHPGNADEKLRCEAATYAWLQEHCPSVPIPHLYGLGLATGQQLTHVDHLPWWSRWSHGFQRRFRTLLGYQRPTRYIPHNSSVLSTLGLGYLVIETIPDTEGSMLSNSWEDKRGDDRLQSNLKRGLARILLSLAAIPLPRIGAFRLDDAGYVHLDNRPLNAEIIMQENEGFPIIIPRDQTYTRADDFILATLDAFHNRLLHQPNAMSDEFSGQFELAAILAARGVLPPMLQKDLRSGPFVCSLTNLHRSNIIVDDDWNITRIIDLEFACSWPIEFQHPPYWLGGQRADVLDDISFDPHHNQFVRILEELEEQGEFPAIRSPRKLSAIMRYTWASGTFWLTLGLQNPMMFATTFWFGILAVHLGLRIEYTNDFTMLANLSGASDFMDARLQENDEYSRTLHRIFTRNTV